MKLEELKALAARAKDPTTFLIAEDCKLVSEALDRLVAMLAEAGKALPTPEEVVRELVFQAPGAPEDSSVVRYEVALFENAITRERLRAELTVKPLRNTLLAIAEHEKLTRRFGVCKDHGTSISCVDALQRYATLALATGSDPVALPKLVAALREARQLLDVEPVPSIDEALRLCGETP